MSNQLADVSKPNAANSSSLSRTPEEEIGLILDVPPVRVEQELKGGAGLTRPWRHGAVHDFLPAMTAHVIMTYHGEVQPISLQTEGRLLSSRTRKGSITIIPQGHEGHWNVGGPIEVSHVYLPVERFQEYATQIGNGKSIELIDRVAFEDPTTMRILELIHREINIESPANSLFVEQTIDLLCTQLIRGHSTTQPLSTASEPLGLSLRQVKRVTDFMQENLAEEVTLEQLASLVSLSRFHFATAFRQATGITPHDALIAKRMDEAKNLLKKESLTITEIALSVGYQTPSSFTAAFRKASGVTPTVFRHQLIAPKNS